MDPQLAGLGGLMLGSFLAVVGALVLFVSVIRHRQVDPLLATFGAFALLYGIREFFSSELIGGLGASALTAGWVTATMTYLINVPAWGFFWVLLGKRRSSAPYWYLIGVSIFAVTGVLSDLIQRTPGTMSHRPNNIIVLIGLVVVIHGLFRHRRRMTTDLKIYIAGLAVFGTMAVNDNLVSLGWLPWQWSEESIGFLVYVGFLGFIALRRSLGSERQLAAIEAELETARQIQASLLPSALPDRELLPLALHFQPTSAVAGDIYDFLDPGPQKIGLLIADVSGHGVPAALIASMVKVAVNSHRELAGQPAALLESVNRTLCGSIRKGFVTAAYACIDLGESEIIGANAGHPAPLLLPARAGELIELGGSGPILGRFPTARFEESRHSLSTGDRLLLYTDGLVEARNGSQAMFGETRLKDFLRRRRTGSLEDLCNGLLAELDSWAGARSRLALDDDLTLIAAEVPAKRAV